MHDTSTESMSKWRAVGSKRNDSMILSPSTSGNIRKQSRQYRPSKQREGSNSKIFNRNRSRIQSQDNIYKDDMAESQLKINNLRSHQVQSIKEKKESSNSEVKLSSMIRLDFLMTESQNKQTTDTTKPLRVQQKVSNIYMERQLLTLKSDYNKFKQMILSQLETQKNNLIKLVNQILQSMKLQLEAIEKKYETNSSLLKKDHSMPILENFSQPFSPSQTKKHETPIIKNLFPMKFSKNPIGKEQKQGQNLGDPISTRFNNFYQAIERIKSELNELHEISTLNKTENPGTGDAFSAGKPFPISKFIDT